MTISETTRREMHSRLVDVLGSEAADTLMEYLPPVGWADVATKRDLDRLASDLRNEFNSRFTAFEMRITDKLNQQTRTLFVGVFTMCAGTIAAVSALSLAR